MAEVLARRDEALEPAEIQAFLAKRLGDGLESMTLEYDTTTFRVALDSYVEAVCLCRDERLLSFDMFDCLFGVDRKEEGFDVVVILYSTATGHRVLLTTRCEGGRDNPTVPTLTDLYPGADWMERETWDMFGIEFDGHPSLAPRLLCDENFEGWPLRKDFFLASRVAKPWPGMKEPAETDEDGNVIERVPGTGEAPGPYDLDKLMADRARQVNAGEETVAVADGSSEDAQEAEADSASDDEGGDE